MNGIHEVGGSTPPGSTINCKSHNFFNTCETVFRSGLLDTDCHVRFTPGSGHVQSNQACPLWANSGHRLQSLNQFVGTGKKRIRDRKA